MLNDSDFLRYSRQLLLEEFGAEGQNQLQNSRVLIIGLGGLGSPAALYLAAAGTGTLLLADDDTLHLSNLQRQILYHSHETGQKKTTLAQHHLRMLNPQTKIITIDKRMDNTCLQQTVQQADVVLDCTDNMETRHAINAACVIQGKPLISGSAIGLSGQLLVVSPPWDQGCYRCLWPDDEEPPHNCRTAGIIGPVAGVIGTLQALEALKVLTGQLSTLNGCLQLFDGRQQIWRTLRLRKDPHCPICGQRGSQCKSQ